MNRMEKYRYHHIAAIALLGGLMAACSSDSAPYGETVADEYQITVNEQDRHLTFDMERSATVHVNANGGISWTVASKPDWISVGNSGHGTGSQSLTVNVTKDNSSENKRTGTITLRSTRFNHETSIVVEQAGGYIHATDEVSFPAMSDTRQITVTSNVSWRIVTGSGSFLSSVSPQSGSPGTTTVSLTSMNNRNEVDDLEYLTIKPNLSDSAYSTIPAASVKMTREKVVLEVTNDDYWFPQSGGTLTLTVKSNSEWEIKNLPNWITTSTKYGKGNQTVTMQIKANTDVTRYGTFYFKSGEVESYVWFSQDGLPTPSEDDNPTPRYSRKK